MSKRFMLVSLIPFGVFLAAGCQGSGAKEEFATAHALVERIAARHANVVRLTVHAVPRGETQARAVASTSAAKRGQPSDPEDLESMRTGAEVVLQEGTDLDVTLPMADAAGNRTWVAGVTLRTAGRSREAVIAEARAIAAELSAAIQAEGQPLW